MTLAMEGTRVDSAEVAAARKVLAERGGWGLTLTDRTTHGGPAGRWMVMRWGSHQALAEGDTPMEAVDSLLAMMTLRVLDGEPREWWS